MASIIFRLSILLLLEKNKQLLKKATNISAVLFLCLTISNYSHADVCRKEIKRNNIALTGILTVISGAIRSSARGDSYRFSDAARHFVWGSIAGYGFWKAKDRISEQKVRSGILYAQLASSVVENTVRNKDPLSYLSLKSSFLGLGITMPHSKEARSKLTVEFDPGKLFLALLDSGEVQSYDFKNGILRENVKGRVIKGTDHAAVTNVMTGHVRVPEASKRLYLLWEHEAIHVVQTLQRDSLTNINFFEDNNEINTSNWKESKFLDLEIKTNILSVPVDMLTEDINSGGIPWEEIEAERMSRNGVYDNSIDPCRPSPYTVNLFSF